MDTTVNTSIDSSLCCHKSINLFNRPSLGLVFIALPEINGRFFSGGNAFYYVVCPFRKPIEIG